MSEESYFYASEEKKSEWTIIMQSSLSKKSGVEVETTVKPFSLERDYPI